MEQKDLSKYVVKELKVYGTDEWMANSNKRYRRVFDRYELSYVYFEFSFYNKLFDEEDWQIEFTVECSTNSTNPTKYCSLKKPCTVSKGENIVYIRDGWGNPNAGTYWMRGDYKWSVQVEGIEIASAVFHIEDLGPDALAKDGYLDIQSVRLFESEANIKSDPGRKYYQKFKHDETRYVCAEVIFKSKSSLGYYTEFFFHFLDRNGQLKGQTVELIYVNPDTQDLNYTLTSGWGSAVPGYWSDNNYSLDIFFMGKLISSLPFEIADVWEEANPGAPQVSARSNIPAITTPETASTDPAIILEESLKELNGLIGLANIKTDVNEMATLARFYKETGKDFLNKFSLHSVFTGNPGTGKTTVARILSRIYYGLGILSKGHLVEVDRETLIAGFIGQTAIKTKAKLDEALGGILFIDEAYSLAGNGLSENDFGAEAIATILKYMEDNRGRIGIIVAGYPDRMQEFIQSNPGLRSRFDKYFQFQDFSPEEMWKIAITIFEKEMVIPNEAATDYLKDYLKWLFETKDKNFGNARTIRQIVAECVKNQNLRLAAIPKEERTDELLKTVILDDVKEFEKGDLQRWGKGQDRTRIGFN